MSSTIPVNICLDPDISPSRLGSYGRSEGKNQCLHIEPLEALRAQHMRGNDEVKSIDEPGVDKRAL